MPLLAPDLDRTPPTPAAQQAALVVIGQALEPLRREAKLPGYTLRAGTRLRQLWGRCTVFRDGRPPEILIRCVADGGPPKRWRREGAIVATLLHEMAHLKYRGHGPRFWRLHRDLLDRAAELGLYDPDLDDPEEVARGAEKLAGSAAHAQAEAARARRRERAAANRAAARSWSVGDLARVDVRRGVLVGAPVRVLSIARGWLTVRAEGGPASGQRFRVAASALRGVVETPAVSARSSGTLGA